MDIHLHAEERLGCWSCNEQRRHTCCGHGKVEEWEVLVGKEGQQQLGLAIWDPCCEPCVELQITMLVKLIAKSI